MAAGSRNWLAIVRRSSAPAGSLGASRASQSGRAEVVGRAPAEGGREPGVHPLQRRHPLEEGPDVAVERRPHRRGEHAGGDEDVGEQVPHRADRLLGGRVVGRGDDDPGRVHRQLAALELDGGGDRPVGHVVVPVLVVGEGHRPGAGRRGRHAPAPEHHQPARVVGAHLAQVDGRAHEAGRCRRRARGRGRRDRRSCGGRGRSPGWPGRPPRRCAASTAGRRPPRGCRGRAGTRTRPPWCWPGGRSSSTLAFDAVSSATAWPAALRP